MGKVLRRRNTMKRVVTLDEEEWLSTPLKESQKLVSYVLWHYPYCRGMIKVKKISKTKQVLLCEGCYWRHIISNRVKLIEDLRKEI